MFLKIIFFLLSPLKPFALKRVRRHFTRARVMSSELLLDSRKTEKLSKKLVPIHPHRVQERIFKDQT